MAFASGRLPEGLAGWHIEILSIKEDNDNASLHLVGDRQARSGLRGGEVLSRGQFCPDSTLISGQRHYQAEEVFWKRRCRDPNIDTVFIIRPPPVSDINLIASRLRLKQDVKFVDMTRSKSLVVKSNIGLLCCTPALLISPYSPPYFFTIFTIALVPA